MKLLLSLISVVTDAFSSKPEVCKGGPMFEYNRYN